MRTALQWRYPRERGQDGTSYGEKGGLYAAAEEWACAPSAASWRVTKAMMGYRPERCTVIGPETALRPLREAAVREMSPIGQSLTQPCAKHLNFI